MALAIFGHLQNLWPFSAWKFDDLKASNELVRKLKVPEHTKPFVFAVPEPESRGVIYLLAAQSLSERSAADAECLIRELRPDAVVALVSHSAAVAEIQSEEIEVRGRVDDTVPTSAIGVLKRCFVDKISKEKYENVAGNLVLREIFGVSFHGHFLAARKAAEDVGSAFFLIESSSVKSIEENLPATEADVGNKFQGLALQPTSLVPLKAGPIVSLSSKRLCLTDDLQLRMVKSLSSCLDLSTLYLGSSSSDSEEFEPSCDYEAPAFAQSFYPLLVDLHNIFVDLPSIRKALAHAQKMFLDVNRGNNVSSELLSEVYTFRIAVEGLRIALNNAGRLPMDKIRVPNSSKVEFSELSAEDKSHALLAEALRSQAKKFKTVVAVVDASGLAGIRKHWNTAIPLEVKDLVEQLVANCEGDGEFSQNTDRKRLFGSKPVVAVGAGATAVLGASSFSKVVPISTVMKIVTFKVPASLKLFLTQSQKAIAIAISKTLGPSKLVVPGVTSSGAKTTSALKAAASAEKIRAIAHGIIASAEKTSLSAMRTAFYEIMRKRRFQPIGLMPWATFGCSVATCSGLLMYGDGIECAAESLPVAPSIASLGRGIRSLHEASEAVNQSHGTKIQKSIESLMYRLKKLKFQ